ncbi:hypothetical protein Nepgr_022169 [Nepenthes gracilis]|uniref:1-phosphatidylinositol-3-phosphate 5-kinase n=1 Tax=Nepenthes gracilis TaxID=150966 RepID=A0AAD3SY96_NEPGR|nr:hypothetical protein Nepgr_022169 [Nepenthes gracilis]
MGVPDNSLRDLIQKIRSFVSCTRVVDYSPLPATEMADNGNRVCDGCGEKFAEFCHKYNCRDCGRMLCGSCVRCSGSLVIVASVGDSQVERVINSCKFCPKASKRHIEKIYPFESPRESPESPAPSGGEKIGWLENSLTIQDDCASPIDARYEHTRISSHTISSSNVTSVPDHLTPISVPHPPIQTAEEEAEDTGRQFFSPLSEYYYDSSDIDTSSVNIRHGGYSFRSVGSSPSDSPSRININHPRAGNSVQQEKERSPEFQNDGHFNQETMAILMTPETGTRDPESTSGCIRDLSIFQNKDQKFRKPLDFENNGHIWFPPPPDDEDDDMESNHFEYDDDDDDIGESSGVFSSISSLDKLFPMKERHYEEQKEPLRAVIHGHYRALLSQLLQGEGIKVSKENGTENWLDVVSNLAWQAANFVKPYTSKGGSMDPGDYVKVKCVASGRPGDSILIKGVVCTKNIKHKRMTSQYKKPRLLLLGGSLEYQGVPDQLASFNMLLEEEMNYIKVIVSKIEAHRPNVILVEKSVSPYAQEYLLAKEISLVLNVKRPLLERIARCTGAFITPSVDNLPAAQIGHCELFRVEKVTEELDTSHQFHKRPKKTLMLFEGCPRRLGCTILLKGSCREELKKVKHVIQYAVFAAYHLSLETCFLADEGATLPKMTLKPPLASTERITAENVVTTIPYSDTYIPFHSLVHLPAKIEGSMHQNIEVGGLESCTQLRDSSASAVISVDARAENASSDGYFNCSASCMAVESTSLTYHDETLSLSSYPSDIMDRPQTELLETVFPEEINSGDSRMIDNNEASNEHFSAADNHRSILVAFSSRCVLKGIVCERSRLLRIKFYGSFDKPLGRYLCADLFDQASYCRSCKEPVEAHVQCYTHQLGSLTINVRRLSSQKLPGEQDGKIWMWHRCLRCDYIDGIPPASRRIVLSDAAWGLSFGKFLELSFSNHATANRVASCGHSLQRDCLRFYGFGSMVAFFHYSPIEILSVRLPSSMLEFNGCRKQEWIKKEAVELKRKMEALYAEIALVLHSMEQKGEFLEDGPADSSDLSTNIAEMKNLLDNERNYHYGLLGQALEETPHSVQRPVDILVLGHLRHSLLIGSHVWNHRLYSLDSHLKSRSSNLEASQDSASYAELKDFKSDSSFKDTKPDIDQAENVSESLKMEYLMLEQRAANASLHVSVECNMDSCQRFQQEEEYADGEVADGQFLGSMSSSTSCLSDKIDSAWTGTNHINPADNMPLRRLMARERVYSFDSATRLRERLHRGFFPSWHLSTVKSFHASGDYRSMVKDPVLNILRGYSQISQNESQKLSFSQPSYIPSAAHFAEGPRLLLPQTGRDNLVIAVYDDEPTSIISYALSSKEHEDWICNMVYDLEGNGSNREDFTASNMSSFQSFGSLNSDYVHHGSYASEDASSRTSPLSTDPKRAPHLRVSFGDESLSAGGKAKFSVTCYFAEQFDMLRKKCCPGEVDFVCSLSRCKRWCAQGGKSNAYFAKSMDERFIIKQVTKTELDSFEEFGPKYFKYLTGSLSSGSPTCLAKILGIYQVIVKHLRGGKETKIDLMVMENLFYERSLSKVYDLKGSSRSRYIPDPMGTKKVLLDMNLLETLRTNPIFLGSKAKRSLERAIWNDTCFLASIDVVDYSLLVGVDEERKELVIGIIDFMRQYTWDKHLETWVKASGILGGLMNASPTIISPKQYKKRFRKAMTAYFLTVPDHWSS